MIEDKSKGVSEGYGNNKGFDERNKPNDEPDNPPKNPKLVIPYYPGDTGEGGIGNKRLWPSGVVTYLCPYIFLNGVPYDGSELPRDVPISITVEVGNRGNDSVYAMVSLYWTDATLVFDPAFLHPDDFSDPVWVYVPPSGEEISPSITFIPKSNFPPHICLIAEVTAVTDVSPGTYGVEDRHYAQHNLNLVTVESGKVASFSFYVSNPFDEEATISVRARSANLKELSFLKKLYHVQPIELPDNAVRLQGVKDRSRQLSEELMFELGAGERKLCQAFILTDALKPGQFTAAELEQNVRKVQNKNNSEESRVGSLGIVIFPKVK